MSDINVMLGKLRPNLFPSVFGPNMDQPLDVDVVTSRFEKVAADVNKSFPNAPPKDAYEVMKNDVCWLRHETLLPPSLL